MATIFFIIVLLHFIVGIGWLAFKLAPVPVKDRIVGKIG